MSGLRPEDPEDIEAGRLRALHELTILDTDPEERFDEITALAAELCGTEIAVVTLIDETRAWFKSVIGLTRTELHRTESFCNTAILSDATLVVSDSSRDRRFETFELVTGPSRIRFYAGVPLTLGSGQRVGTLSVWDRGQRTLSSREKHLLEVLARQVVAQLQTTGLRRQQRRSANRLAAAKNRLDYQINHDPLTGLRNRQGIIEALSGYLAIQEVAGTARPSQVAALFVNIDDFKLVNESLGHAGGDAVLIEVAHRLKRESRGSDLLGRIGADEFIILLTNSEPDTVRRIAERILSVIGRKMAIGDRSLRLSASIGVAQPTTSSTTAAGLLELADRAMYNVKREGGGSILIAPDALEPDTEAFALKQFVRSTIVEKRVLLHFQPMLDATSLQVIGYEALLRWHGQAPSDAGPELFVATAEEIGLIGDLGAMVLSRACSAAASWSHRFPNVGVSVNVSPRQVVPGFADIVKSELDRSGLDPTSLTLELTETSFLSDTDRAAAVLRDLHDLGVRISLDDFGTGFSSMSLLCQLPLDQVKIDRRFCTSGQSSELAVLRASIGLGRALNLQIVAEGIEDQETLERVIDLGCDVTQGYMHGRPAPVDSIAALKTQPN